MRPARGRLARKLSAGLIACWLAATLFTYQYVQRYALDRLRAQSEEMALAQCTQAAEILAMSANSVNASLLAMLFDANFVKALNKAPEKLDYDTYARHAELSLRLNALTNANDYIVSVYAYTGHGTIIGTDFNMLLGKYESQGVRLLDSDYYQTLAANPFKPRWTHGFRAVDFFNAPGRYVQDGDDLLTVGCVYALQGTRFVMVVNLSADGFVEQIENTFFDGASAFLADENGEVIIAVNGELSGTLPALSPTGNAGVLEADGYSLYYRRVAPLDWYVYDVIPYDALQKDARHIGNVILLAFLLSFALVAAISVAWVRRCLRPLGELSRSMNEVGEGHYGVQIPIRAENELSAVVRQFNGMSQSLARQREANARWQEKCRKQELRALRAQLNPHFLYNTLNMIRWMAIAQKSESIERCVVALAELMGPIFKSDAQCVPLRAEVEYLRNYILILAYRFGNQVRLDLAIDDELMSALVPRLILQPLVENSVHHGRRGAGQPLCVRLAAQQLDETDLLLTVCDDGKGIEPDALEALRQSLDAQTEEPEEGLGLPNVHMRILLTYGLPYGLRIESTPEVGTRVMLRMPLQKAPEI